MWSDPWLRHVRERITNSQFLGLPLPWVFLKKHYQKLVLIDPKIYCQKETKLSAIILPNLELVKRIENREPAKTCKYEDETERDNDELS